MLANEWCMKECEKNWIVFVKSKLYSHIALDEMEIEIEIEKKKIVCVYHAFVAICNGIRSIITFNMVGFCILPLIHITTTIVSHFHSLIRSFFTLSFVKCCFFTPPFSFSIYLQTYALYDIRILTWIFKAVFFLWRIKVK